MKVVGVIVEYNPFHHGHAYHIKKAKEITGADVVIAAMSGEFFTKRRTRSRLKMDKDRNGFIGGLILFLNLPYTFAVQKADTFANGAVSLLGAAGCDTICFGSESGNIDDFYHTYHFLNKNKALYNEGIQKFLELGNSYPKSLSLAFQELSPSDNLLDLTKPNNILGFQYVRAAQRNNNKINMLTIERKNAQYHDDHFASPTIASATSIRKAFFQKTLAKHRFNPISRNILMTLLQQYQKQYGSFHRLEYVLGLIKISSYSKLIRMNLRNIYEVEEGIRKSYLTACH